MSKGLRIFSTLLNLIVGITLATSIAESSDPYRRYDYFGQNTVILISRYLLAHFVLLSEIPLLKPFFVENFKFYMFPLGRCFTYAFLAILSFNTMWYGIVNISVVAFIALITLIISLCYKGKESPYLPIKEEELTNNNSESILPSYEPLATDDNLLSIPNEVDIKVVSN
ncbi:hypothetical protein K502DRAFT_351280 [Neoconidiobolus thromboides FSU 785]|nr:hypothetical protein K502DRAFT_351280 [Neoconidiobolus thromboides FSU 785]